MKARQFMKRLQDLVARYGDLPIVGGYLSDDTPPADIIALGNDDCAVVDVNGVPGDAVGFFIERGQ